MTVESTSSAASLINFEKYYEVDQAGTQVTIWGFDASDHFKKIRKLQKILKSLGNEKAANEIKSKINEYSAYKDNTVKPNELTAMFVDILKEAMKNVPNGFWAKFPYTSIQPCSCEFKFTYLVYKADDQVKTALCESNLLKTQYCWGEIMIPGKEVLVSLVGKDKH